jgi:hypothetical protein
MNDLSEELRDMGFTPTGEESPIDESGMLWSNGCEIVCDETATVIDGNHYGSDEQDDVETNCGQVVYRYENSNNVKLIGGFVSNYMD